MLARLASADKALAAGRQGRSGYHVAHDTPPGYSPAMDENGRHLSDKVDPEEVDRILNRLRRVEGQARGLQRMIEEGRNCEDILSQLAATRAALDRVGIFLITTKVRECLLDEEDTSSEAAIERALETFLKYAQTLQSSPAPDGT